MGKIKSLPFYSKDRLIICGTTLIGLFKQTRSEKSANTPSAGNVGLRLGYLAKPKVSLFTSPSVIHLPGRLPQAFQRRLLSVDAFHRFYLHF